MNTKLRHIVTAETFTRPWLEQVFNRAEQFIQDGFVHTLPNKIVATCFFEPSTRTRLSFTSATQRLGAHVLGFADSTSTSTNKGETLEDTIRMVSNYADAIVMRHPEAGSAKRAAAVASVPVINAGDGANQHPTQTVLDLFAIQQGIGRIDNFTILMIGDLEHSRVAHSLSDTLTLFNDVTQIKVDPRKEKYTSYLNEADIVLVTRVQDERFSNKAEAEQFRQSYTLSVSDVQQMKATAKIIAPLPRTTELPTSIDGLAQAYYFQQASFAVPIRAALLEYVVGVWQ